MIRNLKALGVAMVAAVALSAVGASAASAANDAIDVHGASSAYLTANALAPQVFTVASGVSVSCSEIAIAPATVKDGDTNITVSPTYNKNEKTCETPLGAANVTTNGCTYTFTGATNGTGHSPVAIGCTAGNAIKIDAPLGCVITVPGGQEVSGVVYDNVDVSGTAEDDVRLTVTVSGISYTSSAICGLAGIPSSGTNGAYAGDVTVKGFEDVGGAESANRIGISSVTE